MGSTGLQKLITGRGCPRRCVLGGNYNCETRGGPGPLRHKRCARFRLVLVYRKEG